MHARLIAGPLIGGPNVECRVCPPIDLVGLLYIYGPPKQHSQMGSSNWGPTAMGSIWNAAWACRLFSPMSYVEFKKRIGMSHVGLL